MCGIFGYIGDERNVSQLVLDGLKSLEYRGYDSWGVAVKKIDGKVFIEKHTGKIGSAKIEKIISSIGIGHTRWATHGGVTKKNAHPHTDCKDDIIVVHNGIVENYEKIKSDLIRKKHIFKSETDTEVIAHFLEEESKNSTPNEAFKKLIKSIEGMNAIIAFFPEEEVFFVYKNGSPIVIGENGKERFIASDPQALAPYVQEIYFMEDSEKAIISKEGIELFDENDKSKKINYQHIKFDKKKSGKQNFKHFMIKEISDQPEVIKNIVNTKKADIEKASHMIEKAFGTYLVGCGTASYACLAGTYMFSKIAKKHVNFSVSSEFPYLVDFLRNDSLIIALSQSGETIDTISSINAAKEKNSKLLSIVNVEGSTLYRMADFPLLLEAGPEKAVASTKAYTAKITYLYLIAHFLQETFEDGKKNILKAVSEMERILKDKEKIAIIADSILDANHIFILGRGVSYAAALEASLKIKEVSYIHAEGFAAGELKHGVIALIEKGTPVIIFNPHDETYEDTISAAHEVKARGAHVVGISDNNNPVYDTFIKVNDCKDATIIPNVLIGQLLGYYLAIKKGLDPDMPRNLAKSVTVK